MALGQLLCSYLSAAGFNSAELKLFFFYLWEAGVIIYAWFLLLSVVSLMRCCDPTVLERSSLRAVPLPCVTPCSSINRDVGFKVSLCFPKFYWNGVPGKIVWLAMLSVIHFGDFLFKRDLSAGSLISFLFYGMKKKWIWAQQGIFTVLVYLLILLGCFCCEIMLHKNKIPRQKKKPQTPHTYSFLEVLSVSA